MKKQLPGDAVLNFLRVLASYLRFQNIFIEMKSGTGNLDVLTSTGALKGAGC